MSPEDVNTTYISSVGEKKAYEKGAFSFIDIDREVKILCTTEILIGREEVCDIAIPNNRISRKHAVMQLEYGAAKLVDLMSSNGTFRNDERIQGTIILNDGDTLNFGGSIPARVKVHEEGEVVKSVTLIFGRKEYLLTQTEVLIGRNASATDITINDPIMNSIHAQLEFLFDVAILSSLDEERPLLVNGQPIKSTQLKNLTSIEIGSTKLTWRY